MPRYIEYISFCYRMILRLYPRELRKAYGEDIASAFREFLRDEYIRAGVRGAVRASAYGFGEFFTIALPRHLLSDRVIAYSLSIVITTSVLGSLVGVMTARHPIVYGHRHGTVWVCR